MWFNYDQQENSYQQGQYKCLIALEKNEEHLFHWKEMLRRLKKDAKENKWIQL